MPEPSSYALLCILVVTLAAAIWDLRTGEIPNRLVALGALASVLLPWLLAPFPGRAALFAELTRMFAGGVLVSIVPALLFRAGGMGGGDLKLLAAVGLALGPFVGLEVELFAFCLAALYAPVRLIWEGKLVHSLKTMGVMAVRPLIPRDRRPAPVAPDELTSLRFGPAIFAATLISTIYHLGGAR